MMTIPHSAKVYLSLETIDFRKQLTGIKKWVQLQMQLDPFSSAYFFFLSKNKKTIKLLYFDGQGLCLHVKQLSMGQFQWWDGVRDISLKYVDAKATEGQVILMNGSVRNLKLAPNWRDPG